MRKMLLIAGMAAALAFNSLAYASEAIEAADHAVTVPDEWEYQGVYRVTYYCPCVRCCNKTDGITASGTHATEGRTVAAGREFPFGTKLLINGNVYTVEDRGVGNGKVDIFLNDHQRCLDCGVDYFEVYRWVK